jgi:Rps23 Pro-64 3,4-dihydroxylase Tpa1-like proline 4-hydroxylase
MDLYLESMTHDVEPFDHAYSPRCISDALAQELLGWLETEAPWQEKVIDGFYRLEDCQIDKAKLPASLEELRSHRTTEAVRATLGRLFGRTPSGRVMVDAHRLYPGCSLRVHTDAGKNQTQTYRFLIQLNRGWGPAQGGLLMFLDEPAPTEASTRHRYFVPTHGSAVAFAISEKSFHAVSPVVTGTRYTVTYSYEG